MRAHGIRAALSALLLLGCGADSEPGPANAAEQAPATKAPPKVGYDLRRLRPVDGEPLAQMFDRLRTQALADGKQVAVLVSANWCERCRRLELELGGMHPEADIAHVRILELVEEDWEAVTRMNEFDALRLRWDSTKGTYPLLVLLDEQGNKVEEMKEAIERLETEGVDATLPNWFRPLRRS